jgi:hypothetical protein
MEHTESLRMEAALCAWEAMLEMRDALPVLDASWRREGTVALRHEAIAHAPLILRLWDGLTSGEQQSLIPYDWEFVPAVVRMIYSEDGKDEAAMLAALKAKAAREG